MCCDNWSRNLPTDSLDSNNISEKLGKALVFMSLTKAKDMILTTEINRTGEKLPFFFTNSTKGSFSMQEYPTHKIYLIMRKRM